jgi:hypothetical protein
VATTRPCSEPGGMPSNQVTSVSEVVEPFGASERLGQAEGNPLQRRRRWHRLLMYTNPHDLGRPVGGDRGATTALAQRPGKSSRQPPARYRSAWRLPNVPRHGNGAAYIFQAGTTYEASHTNAGFLSCVLCVRSIREPALLPDVPHVPEGSKILQWVVRDQDQVGDLAQLDAPYLVA